MLVCSCGKKRAQNDAIRILWARDPEALDPLLLANQAAIDASSLLHVSLLQPEASTNRIAPALAESLPSVQLVGDSLTRLGYRIRPLAAWDTGQPVLATDVAFTLKLMFCPGMPNEMLRSRYRFIQAVQASPTSPRDFTIVCRGQAVEYARTSGDFFILSEANLDPRGLLRRYTLAALQHEPAPTLDSEAQAVVQRYRAVATGPSASKVAGCGPYQLIRWEKDRYLRFRRKPRWWADQLHPAAPAVLRARPKQLDYVIIPDAATATLALQRGDVDVYPQMPAREFARLRASATGPKSLNFYSTPSFDVVMAGFNNRRPALADQLTRQALARCFDAAGLLRATQMGQGIRTASIISPIDRANYNDSLALIPFDPDAATKLLRQAGWQRTGPETTWRRQLAPGPQQQLRLTVRYRTDESAFATVALQFQAAAAQIGIPITLQPTESVAFTAAAQAGDFDVYVRMLRGNPFMFNFMPLFHSQGAGNTLGFSSPAVDQLVTAINKAANETERAKLLRRFQALLQQEAPLVPLFFVSNRVAVNRRIKGLQITSLKPGYVITEAERVADAPPQP
ncbi:ABC transporter substrate-binding protein [Hymenobacter sp.]|uniref:ABC transporter substrate-binding protein n=1 Tax=Hymenobacter sp. TaxID=1898978 RepID=UPI002EDB9BF2